HGWRPMSETSGPRRSAVEGREGPDAPDKPLGPDARPVPQPDQGTSGSTPHVSNPVAGDQADFRASGETGGGGRAVTDFQRFLRAISDGTMRGRVEEVLHELSTTRDRIFEGLNDLQDQARAAKALVAFAELPPGHRAMLEHALDGMDFAG